MHGYKAHVNVDLKHKLICLPEVTPAKESNMNHLQEVIDTTVDRQQNGKTIHADRGDDSAANRQTLKANKQNAQAAAGDEITGFLKFPAHDV